ncbi:MAG: NHL repeat-containing protein [Bacteroidota bacterium]|nr:NHL repeat-containing protein [Bacteroidota bacterium]MDP4215300.1 NHL repeat-containing protein [Bacteroidota bacterium]MDP4254870.1 NHL repeat-containing protein [Bacteroidota bacterium]MDP4259148.1 NHL repeat-containing protein [Bacteroidota bacterium]
MTKNYLHARFPLLFSVAMAGFLFMGSCRKNVVEKQGRTGDAAGPSLMTGQALTFGSAAQFNTPFAVAVDVSGNVYVADALNHSIRKMTAQGVVTTLAGDGNPGFKNGAGASAEFNFPTGLTVDRSKNVYVVDANNNCIRMIDANGNVTTLAGDTARGFVDGTGTSARFATPEGITIDGNGNLYVADTYNHAIRKISRTGIVTTVAGNGTGGYQEGTGTAARFLFPSGVVSDPHGNLFVADRGNYRVRKLSSAGVTSPFAGDGTSISISAFGGITMDPAGIVYVTDQYHNRVMKIDAQGNMTPFAGLSTIGLRDGPAAGAQFYYPVSLAADAFGAVYVADTYNNRVVKIPKDGLAYIMAGNGTAGFTDGPGVTVEYNSPYGVGRDAAGNTYVADQLNNRIRKINTDGLITTLASNDLSGLPLFKTIAGVVADAHGNVYVADQGYSKIDLITPAGAVSRFAGITGWPGFADGPGVQAQFIAPTGMAIDGQGNLYVSDNTRIRKITPDAMVTTLAGDLNAAFKDGTGTAAEFWSPGGVAVDGQGNVYVADTYNMRIRKITPGGVVTTMAGTGGTAFQDGPGTVATFCYPFGIAVDTSGNVYVADSRNYRIRKINAAGIVTTLAGDGTNGYKDGSGPAAEFAWPTSIALDAKGNLFVADQPNNTIRKVTTAGVVTTFSGNGVAGL